MSGNILSVKPNGHRRLHGTLAEKKSSDGEIEARQRHPPEGEQGKSPMGREGGDRRREGGRRWKRSVKGRQEVERGKSSHPRRQT